MDPIDPSLLLARVNSKKAELTGLLQEGEQKLADLKLTLAAQRDDVMAIRGALQALGEVSKPPDGENFDAGNTE